MTLETKPRFDEIAAERLARDAFGYEGRATTLPGERDQNFLIERDDETRIVLKIVNGSEDRSMLEAQQRAIEHLSGRLDIVPRVLAARSGSTVAHIDDDRGRSYAVWALSWIQGTSLAAAGTPSSALLEQLGERVGELRASFEGFDHPAIHRDFYWDLANGTSVVRRLRQQVVDPALGAAIDRLMDRFDAETAPLLDGLSRGAIHGDLNDHNILVRADDGAVAHLHIAGILDFGDLVHSYLVGDLAIACAYVMLGAKDPLAAAARVVRGYVARHALTDDELAALFGLITLRLCASACIAADQMRRQPDNAYLGVSQSAIRHTLPKLSAVPFGLAHAVFRDACGRTPVAHSTRVMEWLAARSGSFHSILDTDVRRERPLVLDLGVGSPLVSGDPRENAEPSLTSRIDAVMMRSSAKVAVGRYDEPRLIYVSDIFRIGDKLTDERRTLHIGLDLFAPAGTPVFAPLAGVVHALADNNAPQDYGPVIVLRHTTDDGDEFFTLYGHLSRESLTLHEVGQTVAGGEKIATFGAPDVNGGWTPHLHFQIITDLLGLGTDFPGVGRVSQRAVWRSLSPDPNAIVGIPGDWFPPEDPTPQATLASRRELIGRNLSIAYSQPVKVVRGWRQYLYDDGGREYVDAYNNVPHVGHSHPRVVEAGVAQMRVLNTNTRYLNDLLTEYAARLLDTMPSPLAVCYIVNSASEANELALRLARAYTRQRDTIVLEAAYHGNTTSLIDISPYKHNGPGGQGAPDWVHVAPLPDDYRGPHKRADGEAGLKYARSVAEIVTQLGARDRGLAAFIAETCPSVGGQIILPPGYLAEVYRAVRAAGGVCIADEVQTGLGRMGTHFWAFEAQNVVPDIVVMGKPLGNGHPIGAVATTRTIADAFDNGMEYFSTFGGNTVSCAIGLAVLDVLRDEQLQAHARRVGDYLLAQLRPLADEHPLIGDIRGSGLFLGVELVRDRTTLEPAGDEAAFVANVMRENGILLGTDGPFHNVVKIRPPMPFDESDADLLVDAVKRALSRLTRD